MSLSNVNALIARRGVPSRRWSLACGVMLLGATLMCGCDKKTASAPNTPPAGTKTPAAGSNTPTISANASLKEARAAFRTRLSRSNYQASGRVRPPSFQAYQLVNFQAPLGMTCAYVTKDPGGGKRLPLVVWAHGDYAGISPLDLERGTVEADIGPDSFREAGFAVLYPGRRGENDNPDSFELYYGEVDDLIAAVEYGRNLPYVDPDRIYLMGHSAGGTLVLLAVEMGVPVRAAFSFGGDPDVSEGINKSDGVYLQRFTVPFDFHNQWEVRLRSPVNWVKDIQVPTFYIEGQDTDQPLDSARKMSANAKEKNTPLEVHIIQGAMHNDLRATKRLITEKLLKDTGKTLQFSLTDDELKQAHDAMNKAKPAKVDPFIQLTPEALDLVKKDLSTAQSKSRSELRTYTRIWRTPDGRPAIMFDRGFDIDDFTCTVGGVTFAIDRAAKDAFGPMSAKVETVDGERVVSITPGGSGK